MIKLLKGMSPDGDAGPTRVLEKYPMTKRSGYGRVTFSHAFTLKGLAEKQPAGTYSIETRAESSGLFPFLRSNHASTWIRICRGSGLYAVLQLIEIDPIDLAAALTRDAAVNSGAGR